MKTVLATLALMAPVLTFVALDAPAQNMSQMGNRTNARAIPAELLVVPQAWWTDQGNPEIACYHYDNGPYRDRLIDWCLAKIRGGK